MTATIVRLRNFVEEMTALARETDNETTLIPKGKSLLAKLIVQDDWLPDEFAQEKTGRYAQYLLHCDPLERFSVVSFVWGKGQFTPIHNHTIWGIVGVLRGIELCEEFDFKGGVICDLGRSHKMHPGQVEAVSPTIGDWHRVSNASEGTSISIHVYGAISERPEGIVGMKPDKSSTSFRVATIGPFRICGDSPDCAVCRGSVKAFSSR